VLAQLNLMLPEALGQASWDAVVNPQQLLPALGSPKFVAVTLGYGLLAVYYSMCGLFLLVLFRLALRRPQLAVFAFVLFVGLFEATYGQHPLLSIPYGLAMGATTAWILLRQGLVAMFVATATQFILLGSPLTLDLDVWYGGTGLLTAGMVLAVGVLGLWITAFPRARSHDLTL
jgi:hypothetical protein